MAEPYLGQIEAFAFGYAPKGWALCAGQMLPIAQNQALFALLGTTYGGDGRTKFALPDLRGRLAMGQGDGPGLASRRIGETTGEERHALLMSEIPAHTHALNVTANAPITTNTDVPGSVTLLAQTTAVDTGGATIPLSLYVADPAPSQALAPEAISIAGGGQAHSNLMPFGTLNFCIALQGIFPSRN